VTTYAGKCYSVVSVGGTPQHGSILTRSNAAHKRLQWYPNQTTGYSALVVKPGDMRDLSRMTWAGFLNGSNSGLIAGLCALTGSPTFDASLVASIATQTVVYGGVGAGAYSTAGCFGTRLRLSGRSNQLVRFSLEMMGKVATASSVSGPGLVESEDFFPLEKGSGGVEILGFDIDYRTGFFARFAPDGSVGYTAINESLRLRQLRATLFFAQGSAAMSAFGSYTGVTRAAPTLSLSAYDGSSCVIEVGGYYGDWETGEVAGIMVARAALTGVADSGVMISMN
jgi:hypothetical protein